MKFVTKLLCSTRTADIMNIDMLVMKSVSKGACKVDMDTTVRGTGSHERLPYRVFFGILFLEVYLNCDLCTYGPVNVSSCEVRGRKSLYSTTVTNR